MSALIQCGRCPATHDMTFDENSHNHGFILIGGKWVCPGCVTNDEEILDKIEKLKERLTKQAKGIDRLADDIMEDM